MTKILHIRTEDIQNLALQVRQTSSEITKNVQSLANELSQIEWEGQNKSILLASYNEIEIQILRLTEDGRILGDRLSKVVDEWERVGQTTVVVAGIALGGGTYTQINGSNQESGKNSQRNNLNLVGNPKEISRYAQKQIGNTCDLYAQGTSMEAITGRSFNLEEAKKLGVKVGYVNIMGIEGSLGLGKLWQHYGISYETFRRDGLLGTGIPSEKDYHDATEFLVDNLKANKAVLVGVEADNLYNGIGGIKADFNPYNRGHAVWVTGLEMDESKNIVSVIMNDSALGYSTKAPIKNFMDAWQLKRFLAIASKEPMKI